MTEKPIPRWSSRLYARVDRKEIAYVRFVVEAHDNLAVVSAVDKYQAVVRLLFAPGQEDVVRSVLQGLSEEIRLEMIEVPGKFEARSSKPEGEDTGKS